MGRRSIRPPSRELGAMAGDGGDRYGLVRIGMQRSVMTCILILQYGGRGLTDLRAGYAIDATGLQTDGPERSAFAHRGRAAPRLSMVRSCQTTRRVLTSSLLFRVVPSKSNSYPQEVSIAQPWTDRGHLPMLIPRPDSPAHSPALPPHSPR